MLGESRVLSHGPNSRRKELLWPNLDSVIRQHLPRHPVCPRAKFRLKPSKKVNQILYIAKCINTFHGDWGVLWEPGSYSSATLGDADAVLDKTLYTL